MGLRSMVTFWRRLIFVGLVFLIVERAFGVPGPVGDPRRCLRLEVENLPLSLGAKAELILASGLDGFGLRLQDLLSLKINLAELKSRAEVSRYLDRLGLSFGLSEDEIAEYLQHGFVTRLRKAARRESSLKQSLSSLAHIVLEKIGNPSAREISANFCRRDFEETLMVRSQTVDEIAGFVKGSGFVLSTEPANYSGSSYVNLPKSARSALDQLGRPSFKELASNYSFKKFLELGLDAQTAEQIMNFIANAGYSIFDERSEAPKEYAVLSKSTKNLLVQLGNPDAKTLARDYTLSSLLDVRGSDRHKLVEILRMVEAKGGFIDFGPRVRLCSALLIDNDPYTTTPVEVVESR